MGTWKTTLHVVCLLLAIVSLAITEKSDSRVVHAKRSIEDEAGSGDANEQMNTTGEYMRDETSTPEILSITNPGNMPASEIELTSATTVPEKSIAGGESKEKKDFLRYWFNYMVNWLANYKPVQQATDGTDGPTTTTENYITDRKEIVFDIGHDKDSIDLTQNWNLNSNQSAALLKIDYPINIPNRAKDGVQEVDLTNQWVFVNNNSNSKADESDYPVSKISNAFYESVTESVKDKDSLNSSSLPHSIHKRHSLDDVTSENLTDNSRTNDTGFNFMELFNNTYSKNKTSDNDTGFNFLELVNELLSISSNTFDGNNSSKGNDKAEQIQDENHSQDSYPNILTDRWTNNGQWFLSNDKNTRPSHYKDSEDNRQTIYQMGNEDGFQTLESGSNSADSWLDVLIQLLSSYDEYDLSGYGTLSSCASNFDANQKSNDWLNNKDRWYSHNFKTQNKLFNKQFVLEDNLPSAVEDWLMQIYKATINNDISTGLDGDLTYLDNDQEVFEEDYETVARVHVGPPRSGFTNGLTSIGNCRNGKKNGYSVEITLCAPIEVNYAVYFNVINSQNDMYHDFTLKSPFKETNFPDFRELNVQFEFSVPRYFGTIEYFDIMFLNLTELNNERTIYLSKVAIRNKCTGCEQQVLDPMYPMCNPLQYNHRHYGSFDGNLCPMHNKFPDIDDNNVYYGPMINKFPVMNDNNGYYVPMYNKFPVVNDNNAYYGPMHYKFPVINDNNVYYGPYGLESMNSRGYFLSENNLRPEPTPTGGGYEPMHNMFPVIYDNNVYYGPYGLESMNSHGYFISENNRRPKPIATDGGYVNPLKTGSKNAHYPENDISYKGSYVPRYFFREYNIMTETTTATTTTVSGYEYPMKAGTDNDFYPENGFSSKDQKKPESIYTPRYLFREFNMMPETTTATPTTVSSYANPMKTGTENFYPLQRVEENSTEPNANIMEYLQPQTSAARPKNINNRPGDYNGNTWHGQIKGMKHHEGPKHNLFNWQMEPEIIPMPVKSREYEIVFETGPETDAGSENVVFFVVFNDQKQRSREFRFKPEDGKFRRNKKYSFPFTVPRDFGPLDEYQIKLGGILDDNWKVDSVHISDREAGSLHYKRVGRYLSPNTMLRYMLKSEMENSYLINELNDYSGGSEVYVVIFQSGNETNVKLDRTVHFKVFNENSEESKEFVFQKSLGKYLGQYQESFEFSVPRSFGSITEFELLQTNKGKRIWILESVSIVNQNTECSQDLNINDNIKPNNKITYNIDPSSDESCDVSDLPSSENRMVIRPQVCGFVMVDSSNHRRKQNHMYTVTFESGYHSDGSVVNSVNFRVFDRKTVSGTFNFKQKNDGFYDGQRISFNFSLPSNFEMIEQFEIVPVSKTDKGGWQLEKVSIVDAKSGRQFSTEIKQYLNMNKGYLFDITPFPSNVQIETTTQLFTTDHPVNVDFTVTFENGNKADVPGRTAIYLTVFNSKNESSHELRFQHQDGGFLMGMNETFPFQLSESFGDPVSFQVRAENQSNTDLLGLKSITIAKTATLKVWEIQGFIQGGYQYIFQLLDIYDSKIDMMQNQPYLTWNHSYYNFAANNKIITEIPDGPDYVVTLLTSTQPGAESVNPIIFKMYNESSHNSTNEVVLHFSGGFDAGTNRSFSFRVPDGFGTMKYFTVEVDLNNPNMVITDSWILESVTVYNSQSHREWTALMNLVMNTYDPGNSNNTQLNRKSPRNEMNSTTVIYSCGDSNITEVNLNDYTVTLALGNVTGPQNMTTFSFGALGDKNQSTGMVKYKFSNDNPTGWLKVFFGFSVPQGFGPILEFILSFETNMDPIVLSSVEIDNNVTSRKQIREINATVISGRDYVYDIAPITCPVAPTKAPEYTTT